MSKKSGNIFEAHVEKMVLAIVGLICFWLLISRVLLSPTVVTYEDKKLGSGKIDLYISEQAKALEEKVDRKAEPKTAYVPVSDDFMARLDSAITLDTSLYLPQPNPTKGVYRRREYVIPQIGDVSGVAAGHLRAVVYIPTEEVTSENSYDDVEKEPNDIDLVTVEARFDAALIYEKFHDSFAGLDIKESWRDPCLALPVFGAVELQRQRLLSDGGWSEWEVVPRTKIDSRREMFEVIEDVGELPSGGMKVQLLKYDDKEVTEALLQPETYQVASAKQEWFPPSLHKKFLLYQSQEIAREKREAKFAEKKDRDDERGRSRQGRVKKSKSTKSAGGGGGMDMMMGGGGGGMGGAGSSTGSSKKRYTKRDRSSRNRSREDRDKERKNKKDKAKSKEDTATTDGVYDEFEEIQISEDMDFAKMSEPLLFWAHDDSVEPEKVYRYRIRLGVFNALAGTDEFSAESKALKEKVILWSDFSEVTEPVEIPGKFYFFPRDIQEAAKTVTVQVCRYVLGYWYSQDFTVKQGEVIGGVVEPELDEDEKGITVPDTIDFGTGAIFVDAVGVNDWVGGTNLRARFYFDMLYNSDGAEIAHMPIKQRFWEDGLQAKYNDIKRSEKIAKEPLREWGSKAGSGKQRQSTVPGEMEGGMMDMMMQGMF